MDYQTARTYMLSRPEAWEDFPFYPHIAVMKVRNKMFATLSVENDIARMNLKCDPAEAQMLRDIFSAVLPAYHMNKRHWNTVVLDGSIPAGELERMIDRSYGLVVKGMTRKERLPLELRYGCEVLYR
ncbi:MmcQ/YjbR family DNA-binding protein [uncultured Amphritea sp.]|uniref:MmcQ/YjbR family DNA-binding protein n=1 Tax=Amphritea sp. TaxID=1872502 RepID=UPI0025CECD3D|nr:MmcQ/YjbR family DNA-binding protein [uncultured Amphritea sp.]